MDLLEERKPVFLIVKDTARFISKMVQQFKFLTTTYECVFFYALVSSIILISIFCYLNG